MASQKDDKDPPNKSSSGKARPQDPYVEKMRPDPSRPPQRALTFAGLLGDSDRPGFRRLYFTRELDYYAEFRAEDIINTEAIPPEHPPFVGLDATRLTVKREAPVQYTRVRSGDPVDEWDLDVAIGYSKFKPSVFVNSVAWGCVEKLSVLENCFTQGTCITCNPGCFISRYASCDFRLCPHGKDSDFCTAQGSTCVTCGGGECPDTLVSCKPCF